MDPLGNARAGRAGKSTRPRLAGPGQPFPLGVTPGVEGANVAVVSRVADGVSLCLFDAKGHESLRLPLKERTGEVWHGLVEGLEPGQVYGFRVEGPWAPEAGNPAGAVPVAAGCPAAPAGRSWSSGR